MTNSRPKLNLEFEFEDIVWLLDSFRIARNTAMMCRHNGGGPTEKRIIEYIDKVIAFHPVLGHTDMDSYEFFKGLIALRTAKRWSIVLPRDYIVFNTVSLVVGGTWFEITEGYEKSDTLFLALKELIAQFAPIDAEFYDEKPKSRYEY